VRGNGLIGGAAVWGRAALCLAVTCAWWGSNNEKLIR